MEEKLINHDYESMISLLFQEAQENLLKDPRLFSILRADFIID